MAVFGAMQLTTLGQALYTKAQTGTQINFTRMQIGSGQLAQGQDPTTLSALINPIAYFNINSISSDETTAYVKGIYENTNLNVSAYACEIGLFANDPTNGEILYAYSSAGTQGDTIPPISDGPFSQQYIFNIALGYATDVTATIPSGTYIPQQDLGQPNGVATLDSNGLIPKLQLSKTNIFDDGSGNGTFTGNVTVEGSVLLGTTNNVSNPNSPIYLAPPLDQAVGMDGLGNLIPIAPSGIGTGSNWNVKDKNNLPVLIVYIDGSGQIKTSKNVLDDGSGNMTIIGGITAKGVPVLGGGDQNTRSHVNVGNTGTQSISASTWTRLKFPSVVNDNKGEWNGTTFTVKQTGIYNVSTGVWFADASATNEIAMYHNGGSTKQFGYGIGASSGPNFLNGTTTIILTAGDTIEIWAYTGTSQSIGNSDGTRMWVTITQV